MMEKFTLTLVLLFLADVQKLLIPRIRDHQIHQDNAGDFSLTNRSSHRLDFKSTLDNQANAAGYDYPIKSFFIQLAEAKGVAGLGKAGGDGSGGSDKAGQQVPPEVYNALTYAGSAFLFTLSVPLILYGLNKLLNRIEDCFGCGPSNRKKRRKEKELLAASKKASAENSTLDQQLQNQKLHQEMQQQQSCKLQAQSILTSLSNNTNMQPYSHQQQQQPVPLLSADSIAITLQYDSDPNYKTSTPLQPNFQQPPFIVSSVPN